MKISTRGRYGLRAMVDVAANTREGECISLSCIAKRQNISESYLEQLFSALKKAGLLTSIRGKQGGYKLCREPEQITVGDILNAIEGPMTLVDCEAKTDACSNGDCHKCATKDVWEKLSNSIIDTANGITLEQLADNYIELNETE